MNELYKFGWSTLSCFVLVGSAISKLFGGLIKIIGLGLCFVGGFLIGTSEMLREIAYDWSHKELDDGFELVGISEPDSVVEE